MTELDFSQVDAFGNILVLYEEDALKLRLRQKLLFEYGEWFLDGTAGVPYRQSIITKPVDLGLAVAILNKVLTDDPDVTGLGKVQASIDTTTRHLVYTAEISTIYGRTEVTI